MILFLGFSAFLKHPTKLSHCLPKEFRDIDGPEHIALTPLSPGVTAQKLIRVHRLSAENVAIRLNKELTLQVMCAQVVFSFGAPIIQDFHVRLETHNETFLESV